MEMPRNTLKQTQEVEAPPWLDPTAFTIVMCSPAWWISARPASSKSMLRVYVVIAIAAIVAILALGWY
jgi:hypothetical protein